MENKENKKKRGRPKKGKEEKMGIESKASYEETLKPNKCSSDDNIDFNFVYFNDPDKWTCKNCSWSYKDGLRYCRYFPKHELVADNNFCSKFLGNENI